MPKVTIEYDLPAENKELESALTGADATRVIDALRVWLAAEVAACARAKSGSPEFHFARGLESVRAQFDGLLAADENERNDLTNSADEAQDAG